MAVNAHIHTVFTFKLDSYDAKGNRASLLTEGQREGMLRDLGVDSVYSVDFREYKSLSPEEFVDQVLCGSIGTEFVLAGENFRFGKNASGDAKALERLCRERGLGVRIIPLLEDGEGVISTTRIRALLAEGNIQRANELLGRSYSVEGSITHGNALGRQWGIKTINIPYNGCLKRGVYATTTEINGKKYKSVTNVGVKPTVTDGDIENAETHLLDFDEEVYGELAVVEFSAFYRGEEHFPDRESLIEAITKDITRRKDEI